MQSKLSLLPKSEAELRIEVGPEEISADLSAAAKRISEATKIPGFRPGHASYDVVKARVGEMKIWEEALETIIRRTYAEALSQNNLVTVGQPYFSVESLAPGNPIVYKVKTAVLPKIKKLADYRELKIAKKPVEIGEKDVDLALKQLSRMQTKEQEVARAATSADKVTVDMEMFLDNVPLEGGQAKGHGIFLSEDYYIPGLNEKLIGIKKDEKREFSLEFPKEHYQKNIAGKKVDFRVTASAVHELVHPAMDDSFAKTLGQESMARLRELIKKNMLSEAEMKENQKEEIEMLEKIVSGSDFEEIPDILVNSEIERMLKELEYSVAEQGLEFNKYLESIKKTISQLKLDFAPRALQRVKTALVIREISEKEKIGADDAEVANEISKAMNQYSNDPEAQKVLRSDEYAEEARTVSKNKKTIAFLRNLIIK